MSADEKEVGRGASKRARTGLEWQAADEGDQVKCMVGGVDLAWWSNKMRGWNNALFYSLGRLVARYPYSSILFSLCFAAAFGSGLSQFEVCASRVRVCRNSQRSCAVLCVAR